MNITYFETLEEAEAAKEFEEELGSHVTLTHQRGMFEMRVTERKKPAVDEAKTTVHTHVCQTFVDYYRSGRYETKGIPEHNLLPGKYNKPYN